MPNWCDNVTTFRHDDPSQIERLIEAAKAEEMLSRFFPCPQQLVETVAGFHGDAEEQNLLQIQERKNLAEFGYKNWWDWCVAEWGTKWDVGCVEEAMTRNDINTVVMGFSSAWSPPIAWYDKMLTLGFKIQSVYAETGVAFCGQYEDGEVADYRLGEDDSNLPTEIKEAFPFIFDNDEEVEN